MARNLNIDWDKQPLGEVSDADLAKTLGCGNSSVGNQRKKRGILIYDPFKDIDWDKQPLGKMSDLEIAKKLECPKALVTRTRCRKGIVPSILIADTCG